MFVHIGGILCRPMSWILLLEFLYVCLLQARHFAILFSGHGPPKTLLWTPGWEPLSWAVGWRWEQRAATSFGSFL